MKTILTVLVVLSLFMILPLTQSPFVWFSFGDWLSDLDWFGLELVSGVIFAVIAVAVVALVSVGVIAAVLMVLFGIVLFALFNSLVVVFPLVLILVLYWLVSEKKSLAS
jgi:purine-cytosine permease-like protein